MLYTLGRLMVRMRWWIIAFWAIVFIASLILAPRVTSVLKSGFGDVETESRIALRLIAERLDLPESTVILVFSSNELHASDPKYISALEKAIAPLRAMPEVARIVTTYDTGDSDMISPDGRTTYAFVQLNAGIDESVQWFPKIRRIVQSEDLEVWVTGGIAIFSDLNEAAERDLRRAEILTLPIVLIALVIIFGSIIAAGLPMVMGVTIIIITLAVIYLLAQQIHMSIFVLNIATFLGLGMAVDYSLLMVSRFREELLLREAHEAVLVTCATAGKAILYSAVTSVIGLSGLLFFDLMMLRSLGIGGVVVILISMVMALSLIPALLSILGRRVDALSVMPMRMEMGRFWFRISRWVMRHPVAVIVPVTVGLLLLGAPFLKVNLGSPWASVLPEDAESRRGWDLVSEEFGPGELAPIVLISTSDTGVLTPENIGAAYDFVQRQYGDPRVVRVDSIVSLEGGQGMGREGYQHLYASRGQGSSIGPEIELVLDELTSEAGDTNMIYIIGTHHPVSDESKALVEDIRASPPGGDLETYLTGVTPELMDIVDRMYSDLPKAAIYVGVATYLVLFWLFRSVVLPLKAIAMNILSILASFGALVLVFQQGHLEWLLGFSAEGFIEASVPIILFSIIFGLSMDYEVFLLSRIKEEYELSGDNANSVAIGMERSGRVITSAALILILVAAGFATGDILIVKMLGFGTALAIFVDSTIVRALLVPALMKIMGDLNWWAPKFLGGKP